MEDLQVPGCLELTSTWRRTGPRAYGWTAASFQTWDLLPPEACSLLVRRFCITLEVKAHLTCAWGDHPRLRRKTGPLQASPGRWQPLSGSAAGLHTKDCHLVCWTDFPEPDTLGPPCTRRSVKSSSVRTLLRS